MAHYQRRMLSTKIWEDNRFNKLKANEKLLYISMITYSDYEGRFEAEERFLRLKAFPFSRVGEKKVKEMIDKIEEVGLIVTYETQNCLVGYHPNWDKYQTFRKDRPKESLFPPPPTDKCQPDDNQRMSQDNISKDKLTKDKINEFKGREQIIENIPENFPIKKQLEERDDNDELITEDIFNNIYNNV